MREVLWRKIDASALFSQLFLVSGNSYHSRCWTVGVRSLSLIELYCLLVVKANKLKNNFWVSRSKNWKFVSCISCFEPKHSFVLNKRPDKHKPGSTDLCSLFSPIIFLSLYFTVFNCRDPWNSTVNGTEKAPLPFYSCLPGLHFRVKTTMR